MRTPLRLDAAQLRALNTLLEAALELPEEARAAWLARLPRQHATVAARLATMLERSHHAHGNFLRRPLGVSLDDLQALSGSPGR